jgi:hypothetical protein
LETAKGNGGEGRTMLPPFTFPDTAAKYMWVAAASQNLLLLLRGIQYYLVKSDVTHILKLPAPTHVNPIINIFKKNKPLEVENFSMSLIQKFE